MLVEVARTAEIQYLVGLFPVTLSDPERRGHDARESNAADLGGVHRLDDGRDGRVQRDSGSTDCPIAEPSAVDRVLRDPGRAPARDGRDGPSFRDVVDRAGRDSCRRISDASPSHRLVEPFKAAPTPLLDAALERAKGLDESGDRRTRRPMGRTYREPAQPAPPPPRFGSVRSARELRTRSSSLRSIRPNPRGPRERCSRRGVARLRSPRPKTQEPGPEPEPSRLEDLWRDGVRRLGSLARGRLEQQSGSSNSASPWSLRARILAWLAEPDIDPELGQRDSDGVRTVLRALDEPPTESPRRGEDVRSAVLVLEDKAPLEIVDLRLCSKVDGFGDFEPFPRRPLRPQRRASR